MCKAVVRSIEEYYRQQPASSKPSLPGGLLKWMEWANTPQSGAKPGLPDCLDLTTAPPPATIGQAMLVDESTVSNANQVSVRNYLIRTYEGVIQLGSDATVFDIDDWHDW
jgi:hypothetical protein